MAAAASLADRNLLFGILALQMDFITRDQLVAGMNAWVLDKSTALGMVMVQQGTLTRANHDLLAPLVDAHIRQHNNDPQQSLAALGSASSARRDLQQVADADVQASLAAVSVGHHDDDSQATRSHSVGEASSVGARFRILRPHAEGGLGKVSVALDEELKREVALKEIKERHADDPGSRGRFLLEAEITGGLEHPGIVPVYGLGNYADGRPFYAMRFIKGDSLKEAIDRFHGRRQGEEEKGRQGEGGASFSSSPLLPVSLSFQSLEFRKLLARFVDVCNAIAYAHSRGVLHRDLKPGNIMLGKYGETLVVDWGLAKAGVRNQGSGVRCQESDKPEAQARDSRTTTIDDEQSLKPSGSEYVETVAGEAIGTPAFMSPEQAAGRLDLLGPASDVYSLGATLYAILTGRPPIDKLPTADVLHRVQKGDIAPPRQVQPTIPGALEAVCRKAMSLQPRHRYTTPRELADDIEHWLADDPVSAWREPRTVKMRRWVGRHPSLVTGIIVAMFLGVIAWGIGYAIYTELNSKLVAQYAAAPVATAVHVPTEEYLVLTAVVQKESGTDPKLLITRMRPKANSRERSSCLPREILAAAYYRDGDLKKARKEFEEALKIRGREATSILTPHFMALIHLKEGDAASADEWFAKARLPRDASWVDRMLDHILRQEVNGEMGRSKQ